MFGFWGSGVLGFRGSEVPGSEIREFWFQCPCSADGWFQLLTAERTRTKNQHRGTQHSGTPGPQNLFLVYSLNFLTNYPLGVFEDDPADGLFAHSGEHPMDDLFDGRLGD